MGFCFRAKRQPAGLGQLRSARQLSNISAVCLAVGLALASPAAAFEIFGLRFFEDDIEDAVIADPQPYTIEVVVAGDGDVEGAVRRASTLVQDAADPASGAAGLLATARGDYQRIVAAMYAEGRYGPVVSISVNGREASTLPPDVSLPDPVPVVVTVDPGPEFRFSRLAIANQAPPTADPDDYVDPPFEVGFAPGELARSTLVLRAENLALEAWRQLGHPKARVASRDVVADHATNTVDVTLVVDPGPRAAFGPVAVTGHQRMDPEFIAWMTGLTVGEEYDPDELDQAQKRLDRLEVFQVARLEAAQNVGPDGLLPFTAIVQELPGRRFGVGATYSSVDGLGVEAFHLWRNLFGRAERLRLDARVASIGYPVDTSQFDYFFGGTFTKPGVFTPDTDFIAAVSAERSIYPTYTETSVSARAGLNHVLSDHIAFEAGAQFERNRFDDTFGTRDFAVLGLYGSATLDFRDNPTNATEGWYLQGTFEPYYELVYGNPQARLVVEGRTYFGFGEDDQFVLAGRLRAGAVVGPALNQIPPDKLFFAGGGGSVRGYGYRSIGVDDGNGNITGGRYLLEGSVEARARVTEDIGVVGFLDGGYVAADVFPAITDLRLGAGVGLRYETGFGPLRADLAIPLNKRAGDPDYAVYVGIGQAF